MCETGVYHVSLAFQCTYRCSDKRGENGDEESGDCLYADDLVLCGESEEDLKAVGCFVEVRMRICLKVNEGTNRVMVLGGEEGVECEVCVDWMRFERIRYK